MKIKNEIEVNLYGTTIVFFENLGKWSFRINNGQYNINYNSLEGAMEYARNVMVGNMILAWERETKRQIGKNLKK